MIHELRLASLPITPVMADAYQLFRDGHTARALAAAYEVYKRGDLAVPSDFNAAHEIAVDAGAIALSSRILDDAPQGTDGLLAIARIRRMATRGDLAGAAEAAEALPSTIDATHPHLRDAIRGCYLARLRRGPSAAPLIDQASESPLTLVFQAMAHLELRSWAEVVERTQSLSARYPRWARVWGLLSRALMALGDDAGARRALVEGRARCPGSRWLLASSIAIGAIPYESIEGAVRAMPHAAPDGSELQPRVVELATWQLAVRGEYGPAARLAEDADPVLGGRVRDAADRSGAQARAPFRPFVQHDNTCVPTSVAMALGGRGIDIDPEQAFREMRGTAGVAGWRLSRWLDAHRVAYVTTRASVESLRASIDVGAPLLIVQVNFLSAHMMLLYGYDDRLRVFRVAEPMGTGDRHIPYEAVDEGAAFDAAPIALFPGEIADAADAFRVEHGDPEQRIASLARRAAMELRTDDARSLFASLPEDHVERLRLAFELSSVFTREDAFVASLLTLAKHPESRPLERLQIMQALIGRGESDAAAEIAKLLPDLGPVLESMHRVIEAWRGQRWQDMESAAQEMVALTPSIPSVWWYLSIAQRATGALREAERALGIALEIDPHFAPAVQMSLAAAHGSALADRATQLEELLEANPLSTEIRDDLASVYARMGEFRRGLNVLEVGVAATPMNSAAYEALARFWLSTNRPDRAAAVGMPEGHAPPTGEVHEGHAIDEWLERVRNATPFKPDEAALRALRALLDEGELTERHAFAARLGLLVHYVRMTGRAGFDRRVFGELLPRSLPLPRAQFYCEMALTLAQEDLAVGAADDLLRWGDATLADTEPGPALRFVRALLHVREGRVVEGSRTLTALAAEGFAPAARELARIELADNQPQRAVEFWKRSLASEPGDGTTWAELVRFVATVNLKRAAEFATEWKNARPLCPVAERVSAQLERILESLENGAGEALAKPPDDYNAEAAAAAPLSEASEQARAMRVIREGGTPDPCSDTLRESDPRAADEVDLVRAAASDRLDESEDILRRCLEYGMSSGTIERITPALQAAGVWALDIARDVALETGSATAVDRWFALTPKDQWGACVLTALTPFAQRPAALDLMTETLVRVYDSVGASGMNTFILAQALALAPNHPGLLSLRLQYRQGGLSVPTQRWAQQVLQNPNCDDESRLLAGEFLAEKSPRAALPALSELATVRGGSRATSALADAYLADQRPDDALRTWAGLLREQPSNADAIGGYVLLGGDHRTVTREGIVAACTQVVAPIAPGFAIAAVAWFCLEDEGAVPLEWLDCAFARFERMGRPTGGWNSEWIVLATMVEKFLRERGDRDQLADFESWKQSIPHSPPRPMDPVSQSTLARPSFRRGDWVPRKRVWGMRT